MPLLKKEIHETEEANGKKIERTIYEFEYLDEELAYIFEPITSEEDSDSDYIPEDNDTTTEDSDETESDSEIEECAGTTCDDPTCCDVDECELNLENLEDEETIYQFKKPQGYKNINTCG